MVDEAFLEVRRSDGSERVALSSDRITLGRSPGNTISFPSDSVISGEHAVLERVGDKWRVRDVGSSNGTYVNGIRLTAERVLQPGDDIGIGYAHVIFQAGSAGPATDSFVPTAAESDYPSAPPAGYLDLSEEWRATPAPSHGATRPQERHENRTPGPKAEPSPPLSPHPGREGQPSAGGHRRPGTVRGVARGVGTRSGENRGQILAFRVDQYDASGNRLAPVGVEMWDYEHGQIGEGEEVEVSGKWHHGTLRADRIVNLSTRAEIRSSRSWRIVGVIVALVIMACFFGFIIYSIVNQPTVENPFE